MTFIAVRDGGPGAPGSSANFGDKGNDKAVFELRKVTPEHVDDGESDGGHAEVGWLTGSATPSRWTEDKLYARFREVRYRLACVKCHQRGDLTSEGKAGNGKRRVKCKACEQTGSMLAALENFVRLAGRKGGSAPVKSAPPVEAESAMSECSSEMMAGDGGLLDAMSMVDELDMASVAAAYAPVLSQVAVLETASVSPTPVYEKEEGEITDDECPSMPKRVAAVEREVSVLMYQLGKINMNEILQRLAVLETEGDCQRKQMAYVESELCRKNAEIVTLRGEVDALKDQMGKLSNQCASVQMELGSVATQVTRVADNATKPSRPLVTYAGTVAAKAQASVAKAQASVALAPKATSLPKAASPVVVVAQAGPWQTAGGQRKNTKKDEKKGGKDGELSEAGRNLLNTVASHMASPAPTIVARQADPAEKAVPRSERPKLTLEEARHIMRGFKLRETRPVTTIIGAGFGETSTRANDPREYRRILRDVCGVDLRKVFSVDWIGKSILEVQLEVAYVETFKALLHNGRLDIDWIVSPDPLSCALFRRESLKDGGVEAVKEAGRKYATRLRKRLVTAVAESHKRYLREESARAEAQITSGIYVPRGGQEPPPPSSPMAMEGVEPSVPIHAGEADPAPPEGVGLQP